MRLYSKYFFLGGVQNDALYRKGALQRKCLSVLSVWHWNIHPLKMYDAKKRNTLVL